MIPVTVTTFHPYKTVADTNFIFNVHKHEFDQQVIERSHHHPVLVDFRVDWCGPCQALAPQLNKAIESFKGAIELAKLEVDNGENIQLAVNYRVRGFPTVILFSEGKPLAHFSSTHPSRWIEKWIEEHTGEYLAG
jgi:thioredoxin 1